MLRLIISGNSYRIIYLHVPAAIWSMGIYASMAVAFIVLHLADENGQPGGGGDGPHWCRVCHIATWLPEIPWGKPMWGTWWVWDARLTSELVLLFLYVGVIALWHAFGERRLAGRAAGILVLIGVVNLPIIQILSGVGGTPCIGDPAQMQPEVSIRRCVRRCAGRFLASCCCLPRWPLMPRYV